jgi:hypothetical protein
MRDISTAACSSKVASAKEGLQHQNDAATPQVVAGDVGEKHSEAIYSCFARYGFRETSQKEG